MSAAYAGPKGEARRHYYRCFAKCTSRYVNVRSVEADAEPLVLARLEELREELAREPKPEKKTATTLTPRPSAPARSRGACGRVTQRDVEP